MSELEIGLDTFGDRTRMPDGKPAIELIGKKVAPRVHELLAADRRKVEVAQTAP